MEIMNTYGGISDASMTANQWYTVESGFIRNWTPRPLLAPILHVRASQAMQGMEGTASEDEAWRSNWQVPHAVANVPGDHYTTIELATTARTVDSWISSLIPTPVDYLLAR
jgi:hypothetical protein